MPPHSLNAIKRISRAAGGATTVNDVCYAAFSGALSRYCREVAPELALNPDTRVSALVPVAFPRSYSSPLTNDWTFISVAMPIAQPTPAARLAATTAAFGPLKSSPEAYVARLATQANCYAPTALFGQTGQQVPSPSPSLSTYPKSKPKLRPQ